MPAGDRKQNGKPKDIVRHYSVATGDAPVCGNKRYGYSTNDKADVTCLNCLKKLAKA